MARHDPRIAVPAAFAVTKIEPPAARARLLRRRALGDRLIAALRERRLVLLCAPAGFGKTTALTQALAEIEPPLAQAWLQAESVDDLGRFAGCLVAALEPFDLTWRVSPDALLAELDGSSAPTHALATALVNALHGSGVPRGLIVVDEVERIEDPAVFELLDRLLQGLPAHWGLVLASRVEPPLALGRWHVRGEVADFRQGDLRFDAAEMRALLRAAGLDADDAALDAVQAQTQGWPAALGLLIGHGRPRAGAGGAPVALDAAGRRQLYDYLATEVLQSLPAPLVDFLLRCAVLGEWTAERCAAVADDARAATWLDAIEQRDLFVGRRDGEPPCWVPDPLFREFLEDQLRRRRPDELPALLDRAAATEPDAARRIEFMLRAGRPDRAAQALLECAPELLGRGGALQVQRLLERFPAPARDALPAWHFVHGQLDWFAWDWPALDGRMRQAQRGFADAGQPQLALAAAALHTLALAGRGELLAARDAVQALAAQPLAAADRAVLEVTRAWVSAALGPRGATAEAIDGTVDALLQADAPPALWLQCLPNFRFATMPGLQPAVERFVREAMRLAGQESTPLRMGARMLTAWRLLWRGDAAAAQLLLDEVADDARWHGMPRALHWSVVCAQATVHGLAGRAAEMHALCELMLENFPVGSPWRRSMLSYWLRLTALVGDHARWAQIYPLMRVGIGPAEWPYVLAGARLADGQDALLQGDAAAAEPALCEAAEALADIDTVGLLDTAQALLALARLRQQRGAAAVAALTPVLRRIAEGGDPLGLTLVGPVVLDELAAAWPRGAEPALDLVLQREGERARQWQAATLVEARTAGTPAPATTDDPLSPRERMVLERIAAGDSNKLIARALNLSPHTVKRHVANILDKLGLATRAQAAAWLGIRAR